MSFQLCDFQVTVNTCSMKQPQACRPDLYTEQVCEHRYVATVHDFAIGAIAIHAVGIRVLITMFRAQASSWTQRIPFCIGQTTSQQGRFARWALAIKNSL